MSSETGKCRWQDCENSAVWGSEFCHLHRPTGTDVLTSSLCKVAAWGGKSAAAAILLHFLKFIPDIGTIFNEHPGLVEALTKNPDDAVLNQAISVLAQAESALVLRDGVYPVPSLIKDHVLKVTIHAAGSH